jgi:hypothetical protein
MIEDQFTLLRRYQFTSEAIIFKGKLESHGIEVFLRDNHTIDTNPLYSNAIGGVKLFVKTKDYQIAQEVLDDVSLYSLDDEYQLIKCSKCGLEQIDMVTSIKDLKSCLAFFFAWISGLFPLFAKYKYKCQNCKYEFN